MDDHVDDGHADPNAGHSTDDGHGSGELGHDEVHHPENDNHSVDSNHTANHSVDSNQTAHDDGHANETAGDHGTPDTNHTDNPPSPDANPEDHKEGIENHGAQFLTDQQMQDKIK